MTNAQAAAISKSEAAVVSAMTNVYFAAQHTLASSLVPDLNRLCVLQGATQLNDLRVDSHTSYEHSSSVSEFQNCMAGVLRSDLLQKIQTSCKYNIMIDESTDISKHIGWGYQFNEFACSNDILGCTEQVSFFESQLTKLIRNIVARYTFQISECTQSTKNS
ncbi:hypothetical protein DPMN_128384 [Dreissena polymorpha]|uniref:DUF4371 domain-containing protein n=1 Tax=Dreissena polymorpha TaxID=45954 RepID=A0A9D4H0R5_DREPO|nr:hypothetical protein DPMN_128384 [Dreissena polymorpha]